LDTYSSPRHSPECMIWDSMQNLWRYIGQCIVDIQTSNRTIYFLQIVSIIVYFYY
jgi:hypothetical protein